MKTKTISKKSLQSLENLGQNVSAKNAALKMKKEIILGITCKY